MAGALGGPDVFALTGTVLAEKFRVDRAVAEGGFGVVYAGHHLGLDIPVAIKLLKTPPEYGAEARAAFIERFVLEAKTIARIRHPAIVQVLDTGVTAQTPRGPAAYMVLEWLTGQTLEAVLHARRGRGGQAPRDVLAQLTPVLSAMAYAHDEGVAHRDIKPANIMLAHSRRDTSLRLLDFGIAKLMDEEDRPGTGLTRTKGVSAFSPTYASPEQISGTRTGPWTDVHALGLIVTEMLVDQSPYRGEQLAEIFQQVLSPDRPTPAKFGFSLGPVEMVLRRALAFRPDERYPNAGEFLDALRAAVESNVWPQAPMASAMQPHAPQGGPANFAPAPAVAPGSVPSTTLHGSVRVSSVDGVNRSSRRAMMGLGAAGITVAFAGFVAFRLWAAHHNAVPTPRADTQVQATTSPPPVAPARVEAPNTVLLSPAPQPPTPIEPTPAPSPVAQPAAAVADAGAVAQDRPAPAPHPRPAQNTQHSTNSGNHNGQPAHPRDRVIE